MAKVTREDIDALNATFTIVIEKSDYEKQFNNKMERYQRESNLKGFRKGKAPKSVIRKMFGKQILAEEVNHLLSEEINKMLDGVDYFGQPITNPDSPQMSFNPAKLDNFEFKLDLGLVPQFEVAGIDGNTSFEYHDTQISEDEINKAFDNARKRAGERIVSEENIQENDLVKVAVRALKDGEPATGDEDYSGSFSIAMDRVSDEAAKKELLTKKTGDTLSINPYTLEEDTSKEHVREYMLGIDVENEELGEEFHATIEEVSRVELAEINQEFFDKVFGPEAVSSEEEAKEKIKEQIKAQFDNNADALLFADIQKKLVEINDFDAPEGFLKRWIQISNEQNISDEQLEKEFPFFLEDLKWQVIRNKIIKKFEIQVTEEELLNSFRASLVKMGLVGLDEEILNNYAMRMMQDKEAVQRQAEELLGTKLFSVLKENVSLNKTSVTEDEMNDIIKAANEKMEAENETRRKIFANEEQAETEVVEG